MHVVCLSVTLSPQLVFQSKLGVYLQGILYSSRDSPAARYESENTTIMSSWNHTHLSVSSKQQLYEYMTAGGSALHEVTHHTYSALSPTGLRTSSSFLPPSESLVIKLALGARSWNTSISEKTRRLHSSHSRSGRSSGWVWDRLFRRAVS